MRLLNVKVRQYSFLSPPMKKKVQSKIKSVGDYSLFWSQLLSFGDIGIVADEKKKNRIEKKSLLSLKKNLNFE